VVGIFIFDKSYTDKMKIGAVIVVTYVFAAALLDVPVEMLRLSGKENLM
jgi:hypothetical protein